MIRLLTYLRQHIVVLKYLFFSGCAAAVVFDCFAVRYHPHFWGDGIRGFWAFFAFFGSLSMIALFKGIYHVWLMKESDYYD